MKVSKDLSPQAQGEWHWKQNRTMQSLYAGNKQLGVYVPMPNNTAYPLEIRESIGKTAPLIAAAPELLEVLSTIVWEIDGSDTRTARISRNTLSRAKAAIKKAEGGQ